MDLKNTFLIIVLLCSHVMCWSQSCDGDLGPVIFLESFGSGPNPGPELAAGATTYTFGLGAGGRYYVTNDSGQNGSLWHSAPDHTPGDTDGYMLLFDASSSPGVFFQTTLEGICPNTNYVFSCFAANIVVPSACFGNSTEPDLRFTILDAGTGEELGTTTTGSIAVTNQLEWNEYGITFRTEATQNSLQVQVTNNAPGGCGNDLVLDDFTLQLCHPVTEQTFDLCDLPGGIIMVGDMTYSEPGTYEDYFPLANSCNDSTVITTLTGPTVLQPAISLTFCAGDSVTIDGEVYTTTTSFMDTLDAGSICPRLQPYVIISQDVQVLENDVFLCIGDTLQVGESIYTEAGTYIDSLSTIAGCDSTIITIIQTAGIEVQLNVADITLELGEPLSLQATSSFSNDPIYSWSPPEVFSCEDCPNPIFQPLQSGVYILLGTDEPSGCADSIQFQVEVLPCSKVFMPNVFSPNGDGVNDRFNVFAKACYTGIKEVRIFDRWGGLVYEGFDLVPNLSSGLWDGTIDGKIAPTGIYVYTLIMEVLDGSIQQKQGDILIVR